MELAAIVTHHLLEFRTSLRRGETACDNDIKPGKLIAYDCRILGVKLHLHSIVAQTLDEGVVFLFAEVVFYASGNRLAYLVNLLQLL